ncbi:HNH endonuclease [Streptomyces purpurogeneiscleroticus]|uniref:HNH endonuclease n=1 Tax=Streptomyces purpurogeneiscleroticus TaxID=68259 RepID=UPI001CBE6604|nr:hypothetical protein [Streptomyces purpurogeneiscleroticus]
MPECLRPPLWASHHDQVLFLKRAARRRLPAWVRQVALSANGGYCSYCGSGGIKAEEVDHVEPLEWGGADDFTNLVPACPDPATPASGTTGRLSGAQDCCAATSTPSGGMTLRVQKSSGYRPKDSYSPSQRFKQRLWSWPAHTRKRPPRG